MSTATIVLNNESIVCRTCLKVLNTKGNFFALLDEENKNIKNVGNIREMLQFCIPELDLYVSSQPVICNQCLPILVQIYNFKIKCLNGENTIRSYIKRNNLPESNAVNLNSVLMDDLKMKRMQIESQIKHMMMLKEIPEDNLNDDVICTDQLLIEDINLNNKQAESSPLKSKTLEEIIKEAESVNCEENDLKSLSNNDNTLQIEIEIVDNSDTEESENDTKDQLSIINDQKKIEAINNDDEDLLFVLNDTTELNNELVLKQLTENEEIEVKSTDRNKENHDKFIQCTPKIVSVESVKESNENDDETIKNQTYNCKKCNFITDDVIKMYDHNRTTHNFDYSCQHCPFSTSKVELLGKHMTMVHPQNMIQQKHQHFKITENYACTVCPFSVKNLELLRSHHRAAHGKTWINKSPIILNKGFLDNNSVQPSKVSDLKILKRFEYTCDVCPYTTKDKSNLRKHLFTHGTKPLTCDHCVYKCVSPYQLRRHQRQKHAKCSEPRPRNHPYELPDLKKKVQNIIEEKRAEYNFKLDSINKMEISA